MTPTVSEADELCAHYAHRNLPAYMHKRHGWRAEKNPAVDADDMAQELMIEVLSIADKWEDIAARFDYVREGGPLANLGIVWAYLEQRALDVARSTAEQNRIQPLYSIEEATSPDGSLTRSSLARAISVQAHTFAVLDSIVDDWSIHMSRRGKAVLALRAYDRLPVSRISQLLEIENAAPVLLRARERAAWIVRRHYEDDPAPLGNGAVKWEPSLALQDYIADTHGEDIDGWLGRFTRALRADPQYIADMLTKHDVTTPATPSTLSRDELARVDALYACGIGVTAIGRELGITTERVRRAVSRPIERELA
ncbi:sigma-70 family RNA polymerase sigma factor [Microbacterium hominis]|uniref:sigma-70 family RNA polymerase sigma factor n=1 Tax=Microbacterium hominis TaxID=162426 RepID=UPI0007689A1E|nr:sigma-70 family RNA polymerase sigma factor [Microbacterium hominis]KXC05776.1 hypothetical protein MhomT_09245 [Microbacterium hominis]